MNLTVRKLKTLAILALLFPIVVSAQKSSEIELMLGFTSYSGDLAPAPFAFSQVNFAGGLKYRAFTSRKIAFSAGAGYGKISGNRLDIPTFVQPLRTVEMEAGLLEITGNFEWYPKGGPRYNNAGLFIDRWSPYFSAGLGLAFADADITTGDDFAGRFPEDDDKSTFLVIPIGGGLRLDYNEHWTMSLSIGARAVFSDYLDGVSQNGNPDFNDWYWTGGISIIYFLQGERSTNSESRN